jgi:predicted O-linked N-acetylglucosamine transferase (SPINDLY family)
VTHTTEEYEALAYELATNPDKLAEIKRRLENNKLTYPLFDTPTFARHLETAYLKMYERYSAGLAPDHLFIQE